MTLIEFLIARYDEREAVARAAIGAAVFQKQTGRWSFEKVATVHGEFPIVFALADGGGKTQAADLSAAWESDQRGAHIVANDPAYVLADLASKRAILEWCRKSQWVADQGYQSGYSQGELDAYVTVLRELARPFAGRPDYDPAWATG